MFAASIAGAGYIVWAGMEMANEKASPLTAGQ